MQEIKEQKILTPEQQADVEKRLREAATDKRIPCAKALSIAKSMGISPGKVGETANKLNLKISKCQLGCF